MKRWEVWFECDDCDWLWKVPTMRMGDESVCPDCGSQRIKCVSPEVVDRRLEE